MTTIRSHRGPWIAVALAATSLATSALATTNDFSIGINFGSDQVLEDYASAPPGTPSSLLPEELAGVPGVQQKNWNSVLDPNSGTGWSGAYATPSLVTDLVADSSGNAVSTLASVTWQANGTWSTSGSRGAAETNGWRFMTASVPDHKLLNGYLDVTGAATPTLVTISNIPPELTSEGYHVYVYANGGARANRGGSVRVIDVDSGLALTPYAWVTTLIDPQTHTRDAGASHSDTGTYLLFTNMASPNIRIEATIGVNPNTTTPRAPINAVQLVSANLTEPIVGAASADGQHFYMTITDLSTSQVDTATVEVRLDGATTNVPVQVSKSGVMTRVIYDILADKGILFVSGSTHTNVLTFKSTGGQSFTATRSYAVPAYTTINAGYAQASVDTSKLGFRIRVNQMDVPRGPASVSLNTGVNAPAQAERQLAGGYLDPESSPKQPFANTADLALAGADGYFVATGVVNWEQAAGAAGYFSTASTPPTADEMIPGIPGTAVNATDNVAAEILTYLRLEPGIYRLGVNSDDGFQFSVGRTPADLRGQIVSSRNANGDTVFDIAITTAGFYPVRVLWWEGNGGANIELYSVDLLTGRRTLWNQADNAASIKAYRECPVTYPYVSKLTPAPGLANVVPNADFRVELTNGTVPVDAGSVQVTLNGNALTATPSGNVTTASRPGSLASLLPGGANNAVLIYSFTVGGQTTSVTNTWSFTVGGTTGSDFGPAVVVIPPGNRVPANTVNADQGGFKVLRVNQIDRSGDANQGNGGRFTGNGGDGNRLPRPEIHVNRGYIRPADNQPYPNLADLSQANPVDKTFDLQLVNLNLLTGNAGAFNGGDYADMRAPAMPGTGTSQSGQDNAVYEIATYLELKTGVYLVSINSDDGFLLTSAPNARDTLGTLVGMWNVGGGSANPASRFVCFVVLEDGIYPFRLLYWQGGGGGNVEFSSIDYASGRSVLVNDLLYSYAIKAYGSYTGPARAWVKPLVYPIPGAWQNQHQQTDPGLILVKVGSGNPADIANDSPTNRPFADGFGAIMTGLGGATPGVLLDGNPVTATITPSGDDTIIRYRPATPLASGSTHTASLVYENTTNSWTFAVQAYTTLPVDQMKAAADIDPSARGFRAKVAQASAARSGGNTVAAAELQLGGTPANIALPGPEADGSYIVSNTINWNVTKAPGGAGTENGGFTTALTGTTDAAVPGIPGTGLSGNPRFENLTAEIFAWLDLPAGYQRFGVNGDDGWAVKIGTPGQTNGHVIFAVDRAAGSRDIPFSFVAPQAGLYPVRLVWYQGGGGGNVEFFTYGANNRKVLVNSTDPEAIKAYHRLKLAPTISIQLLPDGKVRVTFDGKLQQTPSLGTPNWQEVTGATSPLEVSASGQELYFRAVNP